MYAVQLTEDTLYSQGYLPCINGIDVNYSIAISFLHRWWGDGARNKSKRNIVDKVVKSTVFSFHV